MAGGQESGRTGLVLDLAPPSKGKNRYILVLGCGICSTMLALGAVYALQRFADTNVMGWYANYVLPAGALLVGMGASAGYALASWGSGLKVRRGLLALIVVLQVLAYFAAQYMEFRVSGPFVEKATGRVMGFWEYFHLTTIMMSWKETGKEGAPLGALGYMVRLGEVVGFSLGAMVLPALLRKKAYCELCERYMKTRSVALLPAGTKKAGHLWGKKANTLTPAEALEAGMAEVAELVTLAGEGNAGGFRDKIVQHASGKKSAAKLDRRIDVQLVTCEQCASGRLVIYLVEGTGNQIKTTPVGQADLSQAFVREMADRRAG